MRALIILVAVGSALSCASAYAQPAPPLRAALAGACKGGAVRTGQCVCRSGQHLIAGRCEEGHDLSAETNAHRRAANCLNAEAEELQSAESLRGAAAEERRAANAFVHSAAPNQVAPTIARTGTIGDQIAIAPSARIPASPTESNNAPCPPSEPH